MVNAIRLAETALGQPDKLSSKAIQKKAQQFERRIAAARDLSGAHPFIAGSAVYAFFW